MSIETGKPAPSVSMRRWVRVVFAMSLSLNLLIIAAVGAMLWRWDGGAKGHGGRGAEAFVLIRALPEASRRQLRVELRENQPPDRLDRKLHSEALIALLNASPFDAAAFETQLSTQVRGSGDRMQRGAAALSGIISDMSEEQRATYILEIKKINQRRRHGHD